VGDPRVYFAAERTLLAWIRTGLTVMAFGFLVARFGLFLRLVSAQLGAEAHAPRLAPLSSTIGVLLVLAGTASILLATASTRVPPDAPRGGPPRGARRADARGTRKLPRRARDPLTAYLVL